MSRFSICRQDRHSLVHNPVVMRSGVYYRSCGNYNINSYDDNDDNNKMIIITDIVYKTPCISSCSFTP